MNIYKPGWLNPRKHLHTWSPQEIPILYPPVRSQAEDEKAAGVPKHLQIQLFDLLEAAMREDGVFAASPDEHTDEDRKWMERVNQRMQALYKDLDVLEDTNFEALEVSLESTGQLAIDLMHSKSPERLFRTRPSQISDKQITQLLYKCLDAFLATRNLQDDAFEKAVLKALRVSPLPDMPLFSRSVAAKQGEDLTPLVIVGKLFRDLKTLFREELNPIEMLDAAKAAHLIPLMSQILETRRA